MTAMSPIRTLKLGLAAFGLLVGFAIAPSLAQAQGCADAGDAPDDTLDFWLEVFGDFLPFENEEDCEKFVKAFRKACEQAVEDVADCNRSQNKSINKGAKQACAQEGDFEDDCKDEFKEGVASENEEEDFAEEDGLAECEEDAAPDLLDICLFGF
jgi:hypothetical protein